MAFILQLGPNTSGSDSVSLRNPIIGDTESIDPGHIVRKSRGGTQYGFKDDTWPIKKIYTYVFIALIRAKMEELRDFLINNVAELITIIDHQNNSRNGFIISDTIDIVVQRDNCVYDVNFAFEEQTQATDKFYINTESDLNLITEDTDILTIETID